MKAIRIEKNGGPEVLQIQDVEAPVPGAEEVVVKMAATTLNHMDIWVRKGIPGMGDLPLTLGCDGAGTVLALGDAVQGFSIGDRVVIFSLTSCGECSFCKQGLDNQCPRFQIFGEHRDGTHCEQFLVHQKQLIKLPDHVSFEDAAASSLAYLTAHHMLLAKGVLQKGERVLVMAGTSGVGSAAIQIAKCFGAEVFATAGSEDKMQFCKDLGADEVVNHYSPDWYREIKSKTQGEGVDLIVEHVGQAVWEACLKSLAWSGRLVTCGATSGPKVSTDLRHVFIKQQKIIGSTMGVKKEAEAIVDMLAAQKIKPAIAKVFPFRNVVEAHKFLESSEHLGKVVLAW
ncbi:MAG: zinc-binding dehydrogenase [Deltaproteobacteria bacterium]|nr:zinc-binding dehydrogenase [Deltaproteobacteria bacterium]